MQIPYLHNRVIAEAAENFLAQYGLDAEIPVDVEAIVEFRLEINIIPIPDLQRVFDVEGFTSGDLSSIFVDEFVFQNRETRYRFTLAHEVGHIVLHRELFEHFRGINSPARWKEIVSAIGKSDYGAMEYQGYEFAGNLLVPRHHLSRLFDENLEIVSAVIERARSSGFDRDTYLPYAVERMSELLAPLFNVSQSVIKRRIRSDGLNDRF